MNTDKDGMGAVAGGRLQLCRSGMAHVQRLIITVIYRRKLKAVCSTLELALCSRGSHDQPGRSFTTEQSRNQKDLFDCPEGPGVSHTGGIVSIFFKLSTLCYLDSPTVREGFLYKKINKLLVSS